MDHAAKLQTIRSVLLSVLYQKQLGHVGSCLSCVELIYGILTHDSKSVIALGKSHADLALYAVLNEFGYFFDLDKYHTDEAYYYSHPVQTLNSLRLEQSLGHALPLAIGYALGSSRPVVALLGNGDLDEGSTWESFFVLKNLAVPNLKVVIDDNKFQATSSNAHGVDKQELLKQLFPVRTIDGHDLDQIHGALQSQNMVIWANTVKGKGISRLEGTLSSHYVRLTKDDL